jgi:hypothetical protein
VSPQIIGVPAGATYVYEDLGVGSDQTGMLEITGDDPLVFHASVVPRLGGVTGRAAQVPIVDGETSQSSGERMVVQGLRRDAQHLSSLAVVNLAHQTTPCNLALLSANAQSVIDTVAVTLPPLSHNFYPDVLGDSGVQEGSDLRFEVSCSGAAYAFGLTIDREGPAVTALDLATTLRSTLVPPGQEPPEEPEPEPGVCAATSICLELPGVFHLATNDNRSFRRSIPVESGRTFRRIDLEVTVTHGGWDKKYPDGIHNVFWLFSQKFAGNTWAYANARGPNRNLVTLSHNIGLAPNQNSRSAANLALQPGSTYRVRYRYDTVADVVECVWSSPEGVELARMSDTPTVNQVTFQGSGFELWFGIEGAHQIEVPSIGWAFADARVEFSN